MNQEDTYPPQGNGIGDACDCEGDFDCDGDCDGTDAATFKVDFGRSTFNNPCETAIHAMVTLTVMEIVMALMRLIQSRTLVAIIQ